jgi:hypothetical protein
MLVQYGSRKQRMVFTMEPPAYGNYWGIRSDGEHIVVDVNEVEGRPFGMTMNQATDPDNYDLNGKWTGASYDNHTINLALTSEDNM